MTKNNDLKTSFQETRKLLEPAQKIILVSHESTDGDDLGALLALAKVLSDQGKEALRLARGGVPDNLLFLPGQAEVADRLPENFLEYDVLVTFGCGNLSRPGFPELLHWRKPLISIDHHNDTQMFGTVNVWDKKAAASCELVYRMLKDWGVKLDKFTALNLLTGIFADTGGFRHANVTAGTLEIAADLLRHGARLDLVSRFMFSQKDLGTLRAWAVALENARLDPERQVVYTIITAEDLAKAQAEEEDMDGVVELLNTIPEAKFSVVVRQKGDEIKGSLRSENYKGVDVSEIARSFGGGGHKLAAGFKFKGKIEKTPTGWKIT